ncbi:MFS transporter [archaeon]|nr:MFS transporter [archaeon]
MKSRKQSNGKKNVLLFGLTSLLADLSSESIYPIMPFFLASLGAGGLIIGLIGGLSEMVASLLKIFSGHLSDKIGRRKALTFAGYGLSALAKLLLPFSVVWQHVAVLKPVERIGKGVREAPRDALISYSVSAKERGFWFGVHKAMDSFGAMLGSILALVLYWFYGLSIQFILVVSAVIAFIALIPLVFVKDVSKKNNNNARLSIDLGLLSPKLRFFLLVSGIFSLANFSYMFFIMKAQTIFPKESMIVMPLLLYVFFNLIYTLFSVPTGRLADKIGKKKVIWTGYALFAFTALGFVYADSFFLLVFLFCLYGLANAFIEGTQRAFVSDLSKESGFRSRLACIDSVLFPENQSG